MNARISDLASKGWASLQACKQAYVVCMLHGCFVLITRLECQSLFFTDSSRPESFFRPTMRLLNTSTSFLITVFPFFILLQQNQINAEVATPAITAEISAGDLQVSDCHLLSKCNDRKKSYLEMVSNFSQDLLDDGKVRLFDCRTDFSRETEGIIPGSILVDTENLLSDERNDTIAPR